MQPITQTSESPRRGLSIRGISKSFSGVEVLSGIDLDVSPGEVVALIGENGAGKSTLSSIISGAIPPSAGSMVLNGKPYAPASPAEAIAAGIGKIHQEMQLLPHLSIAENVFVGRLLTRNGLVDRTEMRRRAQARLSSLGLNISPDTLEDEVEPFLLRNGFVVRTPRGRMATNKTYEHLQLLPPESGVA